MNARILYTLAGIITILALTSTSTAAYGYYNGYGTYSSYASTPHFYGTPSTFTTYQSRPSGYGLVRTNTPYPRSTPRYENNLFLGHTSPWSYGTYYSAMTGYRRTYGAYRPTTNAQIMSRPYDPYHYYPEW